MIKENFKTTGVVLTIIIILILAYFILKDKEEDELIKDVKNFVEEVEVLEVGEQDFYETSYQDSN